MYKWFINGSYQEIQIQLGTSAMSVKNKLTGATQITLYLFKKIWQSIIFIDRDFCVFWLFYPTGMDKKERYPLHVWNNYNLTTQDFFQLIILWYHSDSRFKIQILFIIETWHLYKSKYIFQNYNLMPHPIWSYKSLFVYNN